MYAVALLHTQPKQHKVLPLSWFASLDVVQIFNIGISYTKLHRVFYSPDLKDDPNFKLELSEVFAEDLKANYMSTVRSVWGNEKIFIQIDFFAHSMFIFHSNLQSRRRSYGLTSLSIARHL